MQAPNLAVNPAVNIKLEDVSKELMLAPVKLRAPVYKRRRFTQVSGGTSLALSGSTTLSQFNIPGGSVWNPSRTDIVLDSAFRFRIDGATNNGLVGLVNSFTDCLPIDSIQLQTANGQVLANIQNAQIYSKVSQALALDLDEYSSRGPVYGDTVLGTALPISQITGCQPANATTASLARTTAQLFQSRPSDASIIDVAAGGDVACVASANPADQASGTDISGRLVPQRLVSGAIGANNNNAANFSVRFKIPLKTFLGTIFAMDRDLYFGQNLQLIIYWKPLDNWFFSCADAAAGASASLSGVLNANNTFTISNYYLYMSEDINAENVAYHKNEVNTKGVEVLVPYTNCSQITTAAAAGTYTISTPLTPGTGLALKRCITIPVNSANTLKRTANNFNVGGVKFSQNQSSLDGRPLQDQFMIFANSDLWNYMYRLIKNSPAGLSQRTFEECCFMMDNFSDADDSTHFYENDCKESGLKVPQAMTYENTFVQTSTASLILAQYQTWCRLLVINSSGISWGSSLV